MPPGDRKLLSALGFPVLDSARELGGFLAFGPRVHDAALRKSRAPVALKLSALPKKCWARALHGISGCPIARRAPDGWQGQRVSWHVATFLFGLRWPGPSWAIHEAPAGVVTGWLVHLGPAAGAGS